jgi:hypothetical protein
MPSQITDWDYMTPSERLVAIRRAGFLTHIYEYPHTVYGYCAMIPAVWQDGVLEERRETGVLLGPEYD